MAGNVSLPEGFVLDNQTQQEQPSTLPPGFVMDSTPASVHGTETGPAQTGQPSGGMDWHAYAQGIMGKYVRPALEIGGAVAGGVIASPANIVVPGVAEAVGVGLGYMGGRRAADALDYALGVKQPKTVAGAIVEPILETVRDIPSAAIQGMSGPIVNEGVKAIGQSLAKAAPRLYESILKIPPSVPAKVRNKAVRTGLEYEVPVSEKGLEGVQSKIQSLNDEIATAVDSVTKDQKLADAMNRKLGYKAYDENMIDVKSVLSKMDQLKQFYRDSAPAPGKYIEAINQYKREILNSRGKEMFANVAQKLKQGIYFLHKKHYGEMKGIEVEMDKAIARGLKDELVAKYPELSSLNAEDSALINLQAFLERAVNRTRNYDIVSLGDQIMTTTGAAAGGAPGAALAGVAKKLFSGPEFKSKLAFALKHAANTMGAPKTAMAMKAIAYGTSRNQPINSSNIGDKDAGELANMLMDSIVWQEANAGTLSDYRRGGTKSYKQALDEAASEPSSVSIPRATVASETTNMNDLAGRMDRLIAAQERNKKQPAKTRTFIPVTPFTYHGKDGDELRYRDKKGNVYLSDPNE